MKMAFRTPILVVLIALGVSKISCSVQGDVTIGTNAIISPSARIIAEAGRIVIGNGIIIQENVSVVNRRPGHTLYIGNGNIFETGSTCEAFRVGDGNILKSNSLVGSEVELGDGIIISSGCRLTRPGRIPNGKIVGGGECQ